MRRRRNLGLSTLVSVGALIVAGFATSPVQAATTPDFEFGASGTGAGEFSAPNDLAINQTSGDVYVTDRTLHRVSKFNAAGEFQLMWGKDVVEAGSPGDMGTGFEICTNEPGEVCKAGVTGDESGSLNQPQGIGVDSTSGAVYVQDTGNIRVQKFDANGNFVLMWGKEVDQTTGGNTCTATSLDTCQAGSPAGNPVPEELEPTPFGLFFGWHLSPFANENRPALTVDEDGYVYVGECCSVPQETIPGLQEFPHARIQKFDANGNYVSVLIPPKGDGNEFRRPRSLAVNAAGDFYVRDDPFFVIAKGIIQYGPSAFTPEGVPDAVPENVWGTSSSQERPFDVDPSNQYILGIEENCKLAAEGSGMRIVEYHPSTEEVDCTLVPGTPTVGQAQAMALNSSHKLYLLVDGSPDRVIVYTTPVATAPEVVGDPEAREITSNKANIRAEVAANLDDTTYHVEFGASPCFEVACNSTAESSSIGASYKPEPIESTIDGLEPDTDYYFRVVATNGAGTDAGPEGILHTYAKPVIDTSCPNHLARQQTHASLLLDCRAYELVTPEEQGGYDVESDVVPSQEPFGGYPHAADRVLFGIHNGGIPGVGKPTNRGIDPYVATRDAVNERWNTEYVGIPADAPSLEPFSSTLAAADSGLSSFVFGGPEICDPCFGDGSAGMPLHRPDGSLVQGMVGSESIEHPAPAGEVRKHLSGDGSHLVFGSEQQFEEDGNPEDGNVTIYDRNLQTGQTQIVSTDDTGATLADGANLAELDISDDGSRVLIGDLVKEEAGNRYWDLYMHTGNQPQSVEVADTASGVLYAGMTADGSKVFFTTPDKLEGAVGGDGDEESADLFRADVGGSSPAPLTRISTGESAGNEDGCDPVGNSYNSEDWNVVPGGPEDCSVVAIGGGGGVASTNGSVYFLSPELLDEAAEEKDEEEEIAGHPNLYLAAPGSSPRFVASLEPDNPLVVHGVEGAETRHTADFQTTPDGDAAVFASTQALTGFDSDGHYEVFRYDALQGQIDCLPCNPTLEVPTTDAALASNGLSISEDGRVFFNTGEGLVLRDTNGVRDVYEWNQGKSELISSGQDRGDSSLLTVSADGVNALFFTRETLAANDRNGTVMKIYDARENGGFFFIPPPPGCRASDECHGAGSAPPAPLVLGTVKGHRGNVIQKRRRRCGKAKVRRHGRCVRKRKHRRGKHRRRRRNSTRRHG